MQVRSRSYLTSGIAALGVGAIALSPIQPMPDHLSAAPQQRAVESMAVKLAATIDPFTPIIDTVKTSFANITTIFEQQSQTGLFPILSAMFSNASIYLNELPDVAKIFNQQLSNLRAAVSSPLDQNIPEGAVVSFNTNNTELVSCVGTPKCTLGEYTKLQTTGLLSEIPDTKPLIPIANILSSPLSGALVGFAGPGLSAFAQLVDSFNAVVAAFKAQDFAAAINEVINFPTNLINASLNGGKQIDLTSIVGQLAAALDITLPEGAKFGLATGGLLTPGVALGGAGFPGDKTPFSGWGGTAWDSVSADATILGLNATIRGLPVGLIATGLGLRYAVATAIKLPVPASAQAQIAPAAATPAAPAAPATPAVPAIPAAPATSVVPAIPAEPATPAVPAADEAPAVPAELATPAASAVLDIETEVEAPAAPVADAPADTPAPARGNRGGGSKGGDNGSNSGGRGHRGAA